MRITIDEVYKSLTMFFLTSIFFMTSEFFDSFLILGASAQNNSLAQFGSLMINLSLVSILIFPPLFLIHPLYKEYYLERLDNNSLAILVAIVAIIVLAAVVSWILIFLYTVINYLVFNGAIH